MGGYFGKTSTEFGMTENESEEDLGVKLTVLRDAMIHLRVQFLHFQSVFKQGNPEKIENDMKALKIIVMVVQNRLEELKSIVLEYTEIPNVGLMRQRIEDFDVIVTEIVLEMKEIERDNFLAEKMEKLVNKLNPFDVPSLETLDQQVSPNEMMKTILGKDAKKRQERVNKTNFQNEVTDCFNRTYLYSSSRNQKVTNKNMLLNLPREENEIRHDNGRILSGQRKIYKIFRKPVVLLVNYLEEDLTLKTLQILNENQIDYSTFDVSTDSEVRLIVKYLSDCETFPQLFVKGNFEKLAEINSLIESLPKLYVN